MPCFTLRNYLPRNTRNTRKYDGIVLRAQTNAVICSCISCVRGGSSIITTLQLFRAIQESRIVQKNAVERIAVMPSIDAMRRHGNRGSSSIAYTSIHSASKPLEFIISRIAHRMGGFPIRKRGLRRRRCRSGRAFRRRLIWCWRDRRSRLLGSNLVALSFNCKKADHLKQLFGLLAEFFGG